MSFTTLDVHRHDDGLVTVTINRPESLNALNAQVMDELDRCFSEMETDTSVLGVVITGSGSKAFVAGADISQFASLDAESGLEFALKGQGVFNRIENFTRPVQDRTQENLASTDIFCRMNATCRWDSPLSDAKETDSCPD